MPEVPPSRKHHRQTVLVGGGNHVRIAHRPARAARRPSRRRRPARRGRRGTGRRRRMRPPSRPAIGRRPGRLHHRHVHRIHAAHLPGADGQGPRRVGENHGVRFHVRADAPREPQRLPLLRRWRALVTTFSPRRQRSRVPGLRASITSSRSCTSIAPRIERTSRRRPGAGRAVQVGHHHAKLALAARTARASS